MTKVITLLIITFCIISTVSSQEVAFTSNQPGEFNSINLSNADLTNIGSNLPDIAGMDFGPDDILYGLDYINDELYSIDTSDASTSFIGPAELPATHRWTGMAYDASDEIMYATATWHNSSDGSTNLYTINITDGSVTLIGSQSTARYIGCIAIDDAGQLWGIQLGATTILYQIDKTDGSVSYFSEVDIFSGAGQSYGMDFDSEDQNMYVGARDSFTNTNALFIVDLSDGSFDNVGELSSPIQALAIISPYSCDFSADETTVCNGTSINFFDESSGAQSWEWSFEGGSPNSSTEQHPTVLYSDSGIYDVQLTITKINGDEITEIKTNYINILEIPQQAEITEGEENLCTNIYYSFTADEVLYAEDYEWEITPEEAGDFSYEMNEATLETTDDYTGEFTIKVRAINMCGDGEWSEELTGTISPSPEEFDLEGGGSFCEGSEGVEITLSDSENNISYELFNDGIATSNIVEGTGSEISFGLITMCN